MTSARVEKLGVSAYTIPTESPESDGTYDWNATTIVVVEVESGCEPGVQVRDDGVCGTPARGQLCEVNL